MSVCRITFFALLLLFIGISGCAAGDGEDDDSFDSGSNSSNDDGDSVGNTPEVRLTAESGQIVSVDVELATTPEEQSRGLMFRESLDEFRGMLFIFPVEEIHAFTMTNTLIPLDMIHIDADGFVVGIVRNAVPETAGPYIIDQESSYVLEVNGGFAARHEIFIGSRVTFRGINGLG